MIQHIIGCLLLDGSTGTYRNLVWMYDVSGNGGPDGASRWLPSPIAERVLFAEEIQDKLHLSRSLAVVFQ